MIIRFCSIFLLLISLALELPEGAWGAALPELVVYTYDSFVASGGLGPEIFPLFEKHCGCKLRVLPVGDSGQLLTRLQLDAKRGKPVAQVVVGIDQLLWERVKPWVEDWGKWRPQGYSNLVPEAVVEVGFLPYDYGAFAFMADRQALKENLLEAPARFSDLLRPEWKRRLLLEDPRTSTPGLAWVLYVNKVMKGSPEEKANYWERLRSQWLTLTPGWDSAYSLFLRKEAPLVWSYVTSQAFHKANGNPLFESAPRYQALLFEEGQPVQIEGAVLVKNSTNEPQVRILAQSFLEFLISKEVQKQLPSRNWMLPVRAGTELPSSFATLPRVKKFVKLPTDAATVDAQMRTWSQAVEGAH